MPKTVPGAGPKGGGPSEPRGKGGKKKKGIVEDSVSMKGKDPRPNHAQYASKNLNGHRRRHASRLHCPKESHNNKKKGRKKGSKGTGVQGRKAALPPERVGKVCYWATALGGVGGGKKLELLKKKRSKGKTSREEGTARALICEGKKRGCSTVG